MTMFSDVQARAQVVFPGLQIKFKDQSLLMKILGFLLFFNPSFMTDYSTIVGNSIYFPTQDYLKNHSVSSTVTLLHELTHFYDADRYTKVLFSFLYLLPQILAPLGLFVFLLVGWKFALFFLLLLAPIPAYFRMVAEKKAYTISLYATHRLNQANSYGIDLVARRDQIVQYFKGSDYYFVWPFQAIDRYFAQALIDIQAGNQPFAEPALYAKVDQILAL